MMERTYRSALEELRSRDPATGALKTFSLDELLQLVDDVSGKVLSSQPGDTYLLFSGVTPNGVSGSEITGKLATFANADIYDIGSSEIGKLLTDDNFLNALNRTIAQEELGINFTDATQNQLNQISDIAEKILFGKDTNGNRVDSASFWDLASEKYVSAAEGNFKLVLPDALSDTSVFVQSELPALLNNTNIDEIDGVSPSGTQSLSGFTRH
ncbi:MAG: hypothetical protein AAGB12_01775 [Pseudomonadota bacterium]